MNDARPATPPSQAIESHGEVAPPAQDEQQADVAARLAALATALVSKRDEAIKGRSKSGIEQQWKEDEDAYEGKDEVNSGTDYTDTKPLFSAGHGEKEAATRSTVFLNITGPYVDAAAARVADMLLPTDDRPWSIDPTPKPELAGMKEGKFPKPQAMAMHAQFGHDPEALAAQIKKAAAEADRVIQRAKEASNAAQEQIDDWLVECQWHAEVRKIIEDCAKAGNAVLKGPMPFKRRDKAWMQTENGYMLQMATKIRPGSKRIDYWKFYPDPNCGENIQNGAYTWEYDNITERQVRDLKDLPGYMNDQIDAVLEEGPKIYTVKDVDHPDDKSRFQIWYFHGMLGKDELEAAGCDCSEEDKLYLPAQVTMINDTPIKAVVSPISSGEFPYDVMVWQTKKGMPWGRGIARQIRVPQMIVNGAARALMDNAGAAAGPMLVFNAGVIAPHDGVAEIRPWKVWVTVDGADLSRVEDALKVILIPMMEKELLALIQMGMKLAEDVTGLPALMQGQQGKAPDTVGGMQILNQNASTVLRRIARLFDDRLTEPHIRRYYDWLMEYGEDDDAKGDFQIDARGSTALVDRDLENQFIIQLASMVMNPAFRVKPDKYFAELCKSRRFDPKRIQYDDDEWKQVEANMQKSPGDPRIAVAQLRGQIEERLKTMEMQFEAQEKDKDRQITLMTDQINERIESMKLQGAREISFDDMKAMLAKTAMELRSQERVSLATDHAKQIAPAAMEPKGRAPNGMAFQA